MSILQDFMSEESATRTELSLSKPELVAAIAAIEAWVTANQASYNNCLPTAAKQKLSAKQKARLLCIVTRVRWEIL